MVQVLFRRPQPCAIAFAIFSSADPTKSAGDGAAVAPTFAGSMVGGGDFVASIACGEGAVA